jgi:hypothetical protein
LGIDTKIISVFNMVIKRAHAMAANESHYDQNVKLHPRVFNFEGLDDEQIGALGRALIACTRHDYATERHASGNIADSLVPFFAGEMSRLIESDVERAKRLVARAALSEDGYDKEVALVCTTPLVRRDFTLAKDVLVHLRMTADRPVERTGLGDGIILASDDMCSELLPEQASELSVALEAAWEMLYGSEPGSPKYQVPPSLAG